MNWIKLLYPKPHFDVTFGPMWIRRVHTVALTIAYYLTQTLGLLGLAIIYGVVILPMKMNARWRKQDLLEKEFRTSAKTYLKKSEDLSTMDFKRMY